MTKKHFVKIAAILKDGATKNESNKPFVSYLARELADMMKADNGRFDRERFLTACGVE